jgi:membrane protease YdiL (CAAX protease family)
VVNGRLDVQGAIPRALIFSSFLLIVGGAVVLRDPPSFGFRLGSIREHWRFLAGLVAGTMIFTAVALRLFGGTPYSDASWVVECVIVPFTEELVFRAAMLTLLIGYLVRIHPAHRALRLAVGIDAVAFGLAHATNMTSMSPSFVLPQVAFAILLGTACAVAMARTRSVYPAMVVHGAINAVVVLA